jgi:molybdenum cofactor cytidylyltransferase
LLAQKSLPANIVVVVPRRAARYRIEARRIKVTFVANALRADGLSSSVRRGIAQARYSPALLFIPVDLAALQSRDLARLITRWRASRRCVVATQVGMKDGQPQGGVPLILPRWLYPRALAVTGDTGLRGLVGSLPAAQRILVDLQSAAMDVDTRQDLGNARHRRGNSGVIL